MLRCDDPCRLPLMKGHIFPCHIINVGEITVLSSFGSPIVIYPVKSITASSSGLYKFGHQTPPQLHVLITVSLLFLSQRGTSLGSLPSSFGFSICIPSLWLGHSSWIFSFINFAFASVLFECHWARCDSLLLICTPNDVFYKPAVFSQPSPLYNGRHLLCVPHAGDGEGLLVFNIFLDPFSPSAPRDLQHFWLCSSVLHTEHVFILGHGNISWFYVLASIHADGWFITLLLPYTRMGMHSHDYQLPCDVEQPKHYKNQRNDFSLSFGLIHLAYRWVKNVPIR